jgi:hypothetical protein
MKRRASLPPYLTFLASLGGVCLLGVVDYATGYELGLFVFYFLPIAAAAWRLGARPGYSLALVSAGVWLAADWASGHRASHPGLAFWDTGIHLAAFLTIAYAVAKIQALLVKERQRAEEVREALGQVKTLTGLLPICAACKKIRDDGGYWQEIERYLAEHTDAQFTHGLCQECVQQFLREAGRGPQSPDPGAELPL